MSALYVYTYVRMNRKLFEGQPAPDFTVKDVRGRAVKLSSIYPKSVLIVFMRYAGCPWCNLAVHRLTMEYTLLKQQDCEVIAFIQSTSDNIKENIYDRHARKPPFPLVADQTREIYNLYGVQNSVLAAVRSIKKIPHWVHAVREHGFKQSTMDGDFFLVPAMFLVSGHSGEIILTSYGSDFYKHETFTEVYEKLRFLD